MVTSLPQLLVAAISVLPNIIRSLSFCWSSNHFVLSNAYIPISVIEPYAVTDSRLLHLANAKRPIVVTESGNVIDLRLVQSPNAYSSIVVTESGSVTNSRLLQFLNAL